jgi:tRNA(Arg) A34 adenosine deaminase TadA
MRAIVASVRKDAAAMINDAAREIPVCATIAVDNDVISRSGNMVEDSNIPFMHAEFVVINEALRKLNTRYLDTASIYVSMEPCSFCSAALEKVRIKDIFFGAYSEKTGAIEHGCRLFETSIHKPNIIGGLFEKECSEQLSKFFRGTLEKE